MTVLFQSRAEAGAPIYAFRSTEVIAHLPKGYTRPEFGLRFAVEGHGWFAVKEVGEGSGKVLMLDRPLPEGVTL